MKKVPALNFIHIDYYSATPKYQQLANSIMQAIREGKLLRDATLPSINELSFEFEISRDTAEKGYKYLKQIGVLGSVPGKGFFIKSVDVHQPFKVFLLFNKLSQHKKIIYDSLVSTLADSASIDFYIYNNDFNLFKRLLENRREPYTHYVIIPHFTDGGENVKEVLNILDQSKLILLDKLVAGVDGQYSAVYENFEKDIWSALEQARPQLSKYHTIKIIFPEHTYYPQEILKGFERFCSEFGFNHSVVHTIENEKVKAGEVYINLMENDLVTLIERVMSANLEVGKDVGVISYNETPLKKIILNGITTISTDFQLMGEKTAELIKERSTRHIEIPFYLTLRQSL